MEAAPLHVGRPNIGDRELLHDFIDQIMDSRLLTNDGPMVNQLEAEIASLLGVRHVVAVCNGTIGLEIAVRALGLTGEVIVPSYTFVATAHALAWCGLTPVFADIDPETHTIDPISVERLITPQTRAIVGVHLWGRPADIDALQELAAAHGLRLFFDAAHAFCCSYRGRMVGGFGDAEVFSFHATKFFNTSEGGAITTNDDALADRLRLMRNFGFEGLDRVVALGTNGKMSEVNAAMGLVNLRSIDQFLAANRENYRRYKSELAHLPGISILEYADSEQANYQYVVMEVGEDCRVSRDGILATLRSKGILARRYFWPGAHRMEPYRSRQMVRSDPLPCTEAVADRVIVLPTGTAVDGAAVSEVSALIRSAVTGGDALIDEATSSGPG